MPLYIKSSTAASMAVIVHMVLSSVLYRWHGFFVVNLLCLSMFVYMKGVCVCTQVRRHSGQGQAVVVRQQRQMRGRERKERMTD